MDLSLKTLEEAVLIRSQIEELEKRLLSMFTQPEDSAAQRTTPLRNSSDARPRRRRSAAVRARMAAAQKARWAKRAPESPSSATSTTKRGLSAAGRQRLSALMKARWAARRKSSRA